MDVLKHSFETYPTESALVSRKHFWLFTPPENINANHWWYLINENDWETVARPGVKICMSLYVGDICPSSSAETLPLATTPGQPDLAVRFDTPTPPWNPLPDDLEFRWL